jgi:diguanylate cyclase (GGDEF)-like protein
MELSAFPLADFKPKGWKRGRRFDAVIVEQTTELDSTVQARRSLHRSLPDTPILLYGNTNSAGSESGACLHLTEIPSVDGLRSIVKDARRHQKLAKKSQSFSRRLRETNKRLQILSDIVSTANSVLEPKRVVAVIMSHIQQLIPSEAWSILLVDEERQELRFEMALGEKGEDLSDIRLKLGEGIAGWVAQTGKPTLVNDVVRDSRFQGRYDEQTRFQTRSILCAPLVSRGRTIGVVEILNRASGSRFTRQDLKLLLTLVEPAAIALENALLFQQTEKLAITDDLTKLYNSHFLSTCLMKEIDQATADGTSLAVIFFDLDGFKGVNDQHGHLSGSRTLTEVGSILKRSVREEDIVSRYGGDEFVVVLPNTNATSAASIAQRIRKELKKHRFLSEFGLHDLIQKADQAMYSVKESGKDAVMIAS